MGRLTGETKQTLLNSANGKTRFIDGFYVIPNDKISCTNCNQSYPVKDIVVRKVTCPQCGTSKGLLLGGKDVDKFIPKQATIQTDESVSMDTKNDSNTDIVDNTESETLNENNIKQFSDDQLKNAYEKANEFSEDDQNILFNEMERRKLFVEEKGKEEKIPKSELKDAELLVEKVRNRIKKDKDLKKDFDALPEEKKKEVAQTSEQIKQQLESDKEKAKEDAKAQKRHEMAERLKKRHPDLEDRLALMVVKTENRILVMVTKGKERLSQGEIDDLSFAIELLIDKYGIENIVEWLPEVMVLVYHIEIYMEHAEHYMREREEEKQAEKRRKMLEEKMSNLPPKEKKIVRGAI